MNKIIDIYQLIAFSLEFEGTLQIGRTLTKAGTINYQPNINIRNTSKLLIDQFQQIVGFGTVNNGSIHDETRAKVYAWVLTRKEIEEYLPKILPYLITKDRQAELILELYSILKTKEVINKRPFKNKSKFEIYTWEEMCIMESIWKECKELNIQANLKYPLSKEDLFILSLR